MCDCYHIMTVALFSCNFLQQFLKLIGHNILSAKIENIKLVARHYVEDATSL